MPVERVSGGTIPPAMRLRMTAVAFLAAAALPAAASTASATTEPGKALIVHVNITDKQIITSFWASASVSGQETQFVLQPGQVRRGQQAYFVVLNVGKKLHNFAIFGKTTKKLRPGAKAHFHLTLARRGAFRYESTLDRGKPGFHGTLNVY